MKKIILFTITILLISSVIYSDVLKVAFLDYKKDDQSCEYVLNAIMKRDLKVIFKDAEGLQLIDTKVVTKTLKKNKIDDVFALGKVELEDIGKKLNTDILIRGNIVALSLSEFKVYNTLFNVNSKNLTTVNFEISKNKKKRIAAFKEKLLPEIVKFATGEIGQLMAIAVQQYKSHDYQSSLDNFKKIIELDPKKIDSYKFIGYIYFQKDDSDIDKAIEYYQKGLELEPNNKQLLDYLSLAYLKKDDSDEAIETLQKITENEDDKKVWYRIGKIYESNEELDAAQEAFDKAIEIDEEFALAYKETSEMLYNDTQYDNAIPYFEEAVKLLPDDESLQNKLAKCYHNAGKLDAAIIQYKGLINEQPDNLKAYFNLAGAYRTLNKYDDAIKILDKLKAKDPQNPKVYIRLSDAYIAKKNYVLTEQNANKAIELDATLPDSYKLLSQSYQLKGYKKYEDYLNLDEKARKAYGPEADKLIKQRDGKKISAHDDFLKSKEYLRKYAARAKSSGVAADVKSRNDTLKQLLDATKKEFFD